VSKPLGKLLVLALVLKFQKMNKETELEIWRQAREAYHYAVKSWCIGQNNRAAFFLRVAIKRSEILIAWLERENELR